MKREERRYGPMGEGTECHVRRWQRISSEALVIITDSENWIKVEPMQKRRENM